MRNEAPAPSRLLQLLILPSIVVGLVTLVLLTLDFERRTSEQQRKYGEATASQLSDQLATYVVTGDILSLNVVASKLTNSDLVSFIAVYNDTDSLIAQSGRPVPGTVSYTSEITFQDSMVGYVRVAVPGESKANYNLLVIPLLLILSLAIAAFRSPMTFVRWLYPQRTPGQTSKTASREPDQKEQTEGTEQEDSIECILVVRVRPAHHMERHFDSFFRAAEEFSGIVEQTTPEELVIHFDDQQAMSSAASAGFVIRELTRRKHGNMTFGGTLDLVDDEARRKAASYLASIADGDLLIAGGEWLLEDHAALQSFHHSLVDSEDLRRIASLTNQAELTELVEKLSD